MQTAHRPQGQAPAAPAAPTPTTNAGQQAQNLAASWTGLTAADLELAAMFDPGLEKPSRLQNRRGGR